MMKITSYHRNRNSLIYLTVFLVLVNLVAIAMGNLQISRLVRLCSLAFFVTYYLLANGQKNKWITIALSVLLLKDIFFQFYEFSWGYKFYLGLGSLAYFCILKDRLPGVSNMSFNPVIIGITVLLVLANTYTLYMLMGMLSYTFNDNFEIALFYVYGALLIIIAVGAVINNNKYNSNRSLVYLFLALAFIFSDIAALFAYYFGQEELYYIDRLFFIAAGGLLLNYGLNTQDAREEFYQYEMIDKKL